MRQAAVNRVSQGGLEDVTGVAAIGCLVFARTERNFGVGLANRRGVWYSEGDVFLPSYPPYLPRYGGFFVR